MRASLSAADPDSAMVAAQCRPGVAAPVARNTDRFPAALGPRPAALAQEVAVGVRGFVDRATGRIAHDSRSASA